MSARPGASQRLLDFYFALPVDATSDYLERELSVYSPGLSHKSRATRLSEMRLCIDPVVRASLATITAWAARRAEPATARYTHEVLAAARRVRDGEALP